MKLSQLAEILQLECRGDEHTEIDGVASLRSATVTDLCFILHRRYLPELASSACGAVILAPDLAPQAGDRAMLLAENPHYSFVRAVEALGLAEPAGDGQIHASAQLAESAVIADGVEIGALAVIGENVEIGAGSSIGAACVIEAGARIGRGCSLHPRVTLARGVSIGDRCILHSGVVVGSDGFGLVMHEQRWHKVPQLGGVLIEDDVEIGANTTIDRGALDDTVIETGCKLDNLIQVAHNVRIGAHTAIAGCVGIAGSAVIGRHCKISGGVGVLGHLHIADHVTVTAMSLVTRDIEKAGVYSSGTPLMENSAWHRSNAHYKSLEKLAKKVASQDRSKT